MAKFRVKKSWLKACGREDYNEVMDIIKTDHYCNVNPFFSQMHVLDLGNGRTWTVAHGRGKVIAD